MRTLSKPNHSSPSVVVPDPAWPVLPVDVEVAQLVLEHGVQRRVELGREDVHLRLGEVGQAAGVVGVEMGDDDPAHVGGLEAERLELLQRRRLGLRLGVHQTEEGAELARVARVLDAEARIDQDQPLAGLDREAVADDMTLLKPATVAVDQTPPMRAERPAVEVVDPHPGASLVRARRGRSIVRPAPEWRNGIRDRLKIDCPYGHVGSTPTSGIDDGMRQAGCGASGLGGAPAP